MTVSAAQQGSDGTPGENAKTITLTSDTQTFAFDDSTDTSATPTSAVFSINQQNLSGAIAGTDITITKLGSSGTINTPTVSGTITNGTGTRTFTLPFSSLSKSDLPLSVSVTKDSVTDTTQIIKVEGGANGVSALQYLLTNEAHIVPASSAGVVSSYTNSGTEIYVYEGSTELDYDGSGTTAAHWKVGTPTVSPAGKITVGSITDGGNYAVVGNHSSMNNSTDSVTISYPISGKTADGTNFSFTKTQTIAKSKAGTDGTPGDNAKLLALSATSQTFAFDDSTDTSATPSPITISVNAQNLSGGAIAASDITITKAGGGTITTPTLSSDSFDLTYDHGASAAAGKVVAKTDLPITIAASKDSQSDTITIFKVEGGLAGADAYTVFLTNESHTFPAAANGDVDSNDLAAGAAEVRVFKGTQQLTLDNTSPYGANTYRTSKSTSGITLSNGTSNNQRLFTPTAVANDTGTATITITDNADNTAFTKTYTFSKSKEGAQGAQGSDSKTVALTAATNVITYNAAGSSPSPSSTITLTADSQNFTDGYFKFTGDGIVDEGSYTNGSSANQDTFTFSVPASYFSTPKTIRVGVSEQAASSTELAFDTVTIVAVQPGADGAAGSDAVTAFLTSEADVVPADADGNVSSFAGSGTSMAVFEGITDKTSAYTYTLVNTTTGLTAALSTNVLTVSGLTPDSGSTDIRATSGSVTLEKTYSIGKSKAGPAGANNQDFSFLDANLSAVQGTLAAGLLMNSDVFGYHGAIGNGVTAALSDFTSFLDKDGNFYLGGNSSGATDSTGGYFAWNNSAKSLLISGSKAQVEVDKFFLGNVGTQFISGSDGNIRISGDVEFEGRNSNGATVYYDNFASYTNGAAVIPANSPQVDGSGVGYYKSGAGEVVTVNTPSNVGGYSGKVLRLGNSSGNDYVYLTGNKLIPFNENSLYEIEFRYKHEAGSGTVYAGIVGFASDGTTYVNVTGANSLSSQHYIATSAQGSSVNGNDWIIRKGYFKGHASTGTVGGQHNSDTDPAVLHSNVVNGYITPMFLANYNGVAGKVLLDYIKITEIGGGGSTKISGDTITTGVIKSNNLSGTVGSQFRLDDGTFKLGGTTSPKLEWNGTTLSVKGNIQVEGGGFNSGAGELFGNPTGHLLASDGRPGGWRCVYAYPTLSNLKSTDLLDGHGPIVEFSRTDTVTQYGIGSHAFPIEVQQNYKIKLAVKASTNESDGFYVQIYEYDSELTGAQDTISHLANNSEAGTVEDTRVAVTANYVGGGWTFDDGTGVTEENGPITNAYVNYNANYIPTSTAKYFSIVVRRWNQMPASTKIYVKSLNVRKVSQGTTITGAGISTGAIQSTNLSTTAGTQMDLDNALIKIGGTGAYTSNNGILMDGPNAKFAVGNASGNYLRFNHQANKLEINADNFGINSAGQVTVVGNITVTNAGDFADPGANVTTPSFFLKFGAATPITSDNFYFANLSQAAVTQTEGGTAFSGSRIMSNVASGYGNGWTAGYATKTTFTSSLQPVATYDIILNDGTAPGGGAGDTSAYHMFGFSDIDSNSDVSTSDNYAHLTHGIYITREEFDGEYYNTFEVRENGGSAIGNSDFYTLNGINPNGTNGPWVTGEDTFMRFTIQPKKGGGAIYKAFKNGNFLVPIWSYESPTYEYTGQQSFFASSYWGYGASYRKEIISDQLSIGAAPPAGTVISGDGIKTGNISSPNLTTSAGSTFSLSDGILKIGGTGAYTSNNGILLEGPTAKFAVGSASGNYMRFNHTAGVLEVSTPNFSIDNSSSVVIQGDLSVVQPDGTVVNLGVDPSEELFNAMIPPSTGQDDGTGRPVDFFSAYGTSATDIFTFTDLNDGNGTVLDIYKSGVQNLGVATKAIAVDSNKYKIRLTLKGGATSSQISTSGLYLRIYESNSQLGTSDKFVTLSSKANSTNSEPGYVAGGSGHWNDGGFDGASWYRVSGSAGVGQGENGARVDLSGTYWPTKYTTFETIYTPTNTTAAFSLNILNWSGNGTEHGYIKDIAIIPIRRASVITGDNIKTGKLESTNLSPGEGSVLDLNSGSMKMGGTADPGLEVTSDGFVTVTNIVEKAVTVTNSNSGSYYQNYSSNKTRLILDGSLGGDVTMNMTLNVAPEYEINDIQFPTNAGSNAIAKLELTVLASDAVTFNETSIFSGYSLFSTSLISKIV